LRLASLVGLFLLYVGPHLLAKLLAGRSPWPRRFLAGAARNVGVRVTTQGAPLQSRTLVVANHISWLDILVLGGSTGTAFVSKAEVKETFILGWLADQNRTLYVDRAERGEAHRQVGQVADALQHRQPLTIFPEGTTGTGRALLPFRSSLLESVAPPPENAIVRPAAIDYGDHVDVVAWHSGESGVSNALRILGRPGKIEVIVRLLDPLPPFEDRKALARHAQAEIADALSSLHPIPGL
jgi:1-acyl-sn-glycerol-3-phosphate acyltransferase